MSGRVGEYRRYSIGDTARYSNFEYLYLILDTIQNMRKYLYLQILNLEISKILKKFDHVFQGTLIWTWKIKESKFPPNVL